MSMPEQGAPSGADSSANLKQRLLDSRVTTAELMEHLLAATQNGDTTFEPRQGTEMLLFSCRGVPCALPLTALREVLSEPPTAVYLPFSPPWMLGIFPLRNELVGLVDPEPVLLAAATPEPARAVTSVDDPAGSLSGIPGTRAATTALVVGTEGRCLALLVDAVGEIANAPDESLVSLADPAPAYEPSGPVAPRYAAGTLRDASSNRDYVLLRADVLLDDMISALEEDGGARHG